MARLTGNIIGAFHVAYDFAGYGLPESLCANAFAVELQQRGIAYEREVRIEVVYKGVSLGYFRADFVVDRCVVVEIKCSKEIIEADRVQLLNYLKTSRYELGLLLNFGVRRGIKRLIYTNDRKT